MVIQLDTLIAQGNTSDVYRWGTDAVVKVLLEDIPDDWATREAQIAERVHAAGLPTPAVLDLITINDRPAIVFELVEGASMWEQMLAYPTDISRLSSILADLQADVNATRAPIGLPGLNDRLRKKIERNTILDRSERETALGDLAAKPDDGWLCHFDMHPNNILMGPKGPTIIDWFDAAAGTPAADIARSSVLMRPDAAECHLPCVDPAVIGLVHDEYIAAVLRNNTVDVEQLLEWESSVLASRLAEPLVDVCRLAADQAWHALRAAQPTSLVTSVAIARADRPPCRTEL